MSRRGAYEILITSSTVPQRQYSIRKYTFQETSQAIENYLRMAVNIF